MILITLNMNILDLKLRICSGFTLSAMALLGVVTNSPVMADSYSPVFSATAAKVNPHTSQNTKATFTYAALSQVPEEVYRGVISEYDTSGIIDAGGFIPDGALNPSESAGGFQLEMTSGNGTGFRTRILASQGNSIRLDRDLTPWIQKGDQFVIRKNFTIASIFGDANELSNLKSGSNFNDADSIIFIDTLGGTTQHYNLSVSGKTSFWFDSNLNRSGDNIIDSFRGFIVRRIGSEPATIYTTGEIRTTPTILPVEPGLNLLSLANTSAPVALKDLNLISDSDGTGLKAGVNPSKADNVIIYNADGSSATYFYLSYQGVQGWFSFDFTPADDVTIAPGQAFYISRQPGLPAFGWFAPAP